MFITCWNLMKTPCQAKLIYFPSLCQAINFYENATLRFGMKGNNVKKCKENSHQFFCNSWYENQTILFVGWNFSLNKSKIDEQRAQRKKIKTSLQSKDCANSVPEYLQR